MNTIPMIVSALLTTSVVIGQCGFTTAVVTPFGAGCNPVVGTINVPLNVNPLLSTCRIGVHPSVFLEANKLPIGGVVVLGLQNAAVPVPALGAGCVLYPSLDVVQFSPLMTPGFVLQLPPTPAPPTSLFVQSAVLYELLGTGGFEFAISDAARIDLQ